MAIRSAAFFAEESICRKANVKSKNAVGRIYMLGLVFRLFFNRVIKHADYVNAAPAHIKRVFLGEYGACQHCKEDASKFRKDYEIADRKYETCNGFMFPQSTLDFLHVTAWFTTSEQRHPPFARSFLSLPADYVFVCAANALKFPIAVDGPWLSLVTGT